MAGEPDQFPFVTYSHHIANRYGNLQEKVLTKAAGRCVKRVKAKFKKQRPAARLKSPETTVFEFSHTVPATTLKLTRSVSHA